MLRKLDKSNAHFRKAVQRLPLGVSSNFRYWGDDKTIYVKRGEGARLWDIDGNEYIDYRLGYGPAILGHCHPEVDAAAREGQKVGTVYRAGHRDGSCGRRTDPRHDARRPSWSASPTPARKPSWPLCASPARSPGATAM